MSRCRWCNALQHDGKCLEQLEAELTAARAATDAAERKAADAEQRYLRMWEDRDECINKAKRTDAAEREAEGLRAAHAQVREGLRQAREGWKQATDDLAATRTALAQMTQERDAADKLSVERDAETERHWKALQAERAAHARTREALALLRRKISQPAFSLSAEDIASVDAALVSDTR